MNEPAEHRPSLQVNRIFHDTVVTSPLIQHKIDLFSAGFKYNAETRVSLADSQKALLQYRSSMDSLHPIEDKMVECLQTSHTDFTTSASGIHVIVKNDLVQLFTLGSALRGIPHKEWEIPLLDADPGDYDFDSSADVITFIGLQGMVYVRFSWNPHLSSF